jgi:hypothetical protein
VVDEDTGAARRRPDGRRLLHRTVDKCAPTGHARVQHAIAELFKLNNRLKGWPPASPRDVVEHDADAGAAAPALRKRCGHASAADHDHHDRSGRDLQLVDDAVDVPVQINGKVPAGASPPAPTTSPTKRQRRRRSPRCSTARDPQSDRRRRMVNFVVG